MRIKSSKKITFKGVVQTIKDFSLKKQLIFLTIYTLFIGIVGILVYRSGFHRVVIEKAKTIISTNYIEEIKDVLSGEKRKIEEERIVINLKYENYQKLAFQRELALKYGSAYREMDDADYVPATITYKGEQIKAKMKLKGGQADHWGHPYKWSFKIKLLNDKKIYGMGEFSLQRPETRNFVNEWVLHQLFRDKDLVALRYHFVPLTVNGVDYDIYALEENMSTELIENNNRRAGPVLNFDTALMWISSASTATYANGSEVNFYNLETDELPMEFEAAKNLIEGYRQGKYTTSEVFDTNKLAKFFAIIDLTGHHHASYLYNLKLYYNPISSKFEPIGYDNQIITSISGGKLKEEASNQGSLYGQYKKISSKTSPTAAGFDWHRYVFSDREFYEKYMKELDRISQKSYLDTFFGKVGSDLEYQERILETFYKTYSFNPSKSVLYSNQNDIQALIHPSKVVDAYYNGYDKTNQTISIGINNACTFPLVITELAIDNDRKIDVNGNDLVQTLESKGAIQKQTVIKFKLPSGYNFDEQNKTKLTVKFKILGEDLIQEKTVFPYKFIDEDFASKDILRMEPNANTFEFIKINQKNKQITFTQKNIVLKSNLIIPKGYTLIGSEGLTLDLRNYANIISFSPIDFKGTEDNPITVFSSDDKGKGLVVLQANPKKSTLSYVEFKNLGLVSYGDWTQTGAVNFFESDVDLSDCLFDTNRDGDDYLNVMRSTFSMIGCTIRNTNGDAFDGDFVHGEVIASTFENTANDGIDYSGSVISVSNIYLRNIGDKGISAGEQSYMTVKDVVGEKLNIGVASKDLSEVSITNIFLTDAKYGFAAFMKKTQFGAGTIKLLTRPNLSNVEQPYLYDSGSRILLFNNQVESAPQDKIREMLYGQ